MSRIAIIGVGAVGGVVAASLAHLEPLACLRRPLARLRIHHDGAVRSYPLTRACTSPASIEGPSAVVFLATKAHQTEGAAAWLTALTGPATTVVVLQNGVEHRERVRPLVHPEASVLPAVVDLPATTTAPGEIFLRRAGSLILPAEPGAAEIAALFIGARFVEADTQADFATALWRKLCVNVASGAIPALTDRPAGVFRDMAVQEVAKALVRECIAVARAEGVVLEDSLADEIVAGFAAAPPDTLNSMLLDRRAGRPLEADARNGAVVRIGARHGLATPYNALASTLLGAINVGSEP